MLSTPTHLNFYVMELFKSKQQKKIEALDLPFACKVVEIKPLKKDWSLAITEKNTVILLKGDRVASQFNKITDFLLATNGMAMVTLEDGRNVIFNSDGDNISLPHKDNLLFPNGFHRLKRDNSLSLYNSLHMLVGSNLKAANVFPNGYYHMSIYNSGNAEYAGVFDDTGRKILFTNTISVKMYPNGWFIAGGMLYDNLGNTVLGMKNGHFPKRWKMNILARIMPKRKREKRQSTNK